MKILKTILTFCILVLFTVGVDVYSEDDTYGVSVFGPSGESSSSEPSVTGTYTEDYSASEEIDDAGPIMVEIEGSRIGEIMVSQSVTLLTDGIISHVDAGMGRAFSIVLIDEGEVERQVYCFDSPEQAVGKKLPAGKYKLYPDSLNRDFELEKVTIVMMVDPVRKDKEEE